MRSNYKLVFIGKCLAMLVLAVIGSLAIYYLPVRLNTNMKKIDLDKYKKVMIVAHPDDEMIWGGAHLIEDDYLVVCVTCGTNNYRLSEFKKVMKATDDSYITLGYPDKVFGERSDWKYVYKYIEKDIDKILKANDWEMIVTHNEKGEYGHIHHKMTHNIVTDLYKNNDYSGKLYFFGDYYSKKKIVNVNDLVSISDELLEEKIDILKTYKTQSFIMEMFDHMFEHEMWKEYKGE